MVLDSVNQFDKAYIAQFLLVLSSYILFITFMGHITMGAYNEVASVLAGVGLVSLFVVYVILEEERRIDSREVLQTLLVSGVVRAAFVVSVLVLLGVVQAFIPIFLTFSVLLSVYIVARGSTITKELFKRKSQLHQDAITYINHSDGSPISSFPHVINLYEVVPTVLSDNNTENVLQSKKFILQVIVSMAVASIALFELLNAYIVLFSAPVPFMEYTTITGFLSVFLILLLFILYSSTAWFVERQTSTDTVKRYLFVSTQLLVIPIGCKIAVIGIALVSNTVYMTQTWAVIFLTAGMVLIRIQSEEHTSWYQYLNN